MVKIENFVGPSPDQFLAAMRGMRNPKNSWHRLDSSAGGEDGFHLGENDKTLARGLCLQGREHRKFLRQLPVIMDITAPLYFWKQLDKYQIGTVTDSCSTMHKLADKPFDRRDFSISNLASIGEDWMEDTVFYEMSEGYEDNCFEGFDLEGILITSENYFCEYVVQMLNGLRHAFMKTGDKKYWYAMNEALPQSYNQKRTWSGNYEVLRTICEQRQGHKLREWAEFIGWVKLNVPYAEELIFYGAEKKKEKEAE